ncbi:hypothetical protein M758_4G180800 [Ceratodon purpureus]|uniref:Uncharacterized protein n=1 Tax=Ceratodon purpureus TaxID=3225 RepID=A0A8T0IC80_CERPU|nr:hypothetical protein KC19_4G178400 [Ceratodon purpureus]KAG0619999.1 hypothetical protein M758_4G180800 [Ceratodon purpureus]
MASVSGRALVITNCAVWEDQIFVQADTSIDICSSCTVSQFDAWLVAQQLFCSIVRLGEYPQVTESKDQTPTGITKSAVFFSLSLEFCPSEENFGLRQPRESWMCD